MMPDTYSLTAEEVESIDFFHDFMAFLHRLYEQPIRRTSTGNISLKDIQPLLEKLKTTKEHIDDYKKHGWRLHTEDELKTLQQIKILSEMMHLTYKRKGKLFLSKNGQGFLKNLTPIEQYKQMILYYWYRVNWDYFSGMRRVDSVSLINVLQENQNKIWHSLLNKDTQWIDYKKFCFSLRDYFHLQPFLEHPTFEPDDELFSDIEYALFGKNLLLFNCVEVEEAPGKYDWQTEIVRFRSTRIGLYLYQKALYENYL